MPGNQSIQIDSIAGTGTSDAYEQGDKLCSVGPLPNKRLQDHVGVAKYSARVVLGTHHRQPLSSTLRLVEHRK